MEGGGKEKILFNSPPWCLAKDLWSKKKIHTVIIGMVYNVINNIISQCTMTGPVSRQRLEHHEAAIILYSMLS